MKQAVIVAKGEVQRVGYRDAVEKIARKLKVTGYVENLKPYDVKIVAEGEQDILDEFVTQIRIDRYPVCVEDIDIEFVEATCEFEYFEIKRGEWMDEIGERMDTAGALLYRTVELGTESVEIGKKMLGKQDQMLGKQDQMLGKQDQMLGKQDQMLDKQDLMLEKQDNHTQIMTEFRDQTQQNFGVLDVKYGSISENIEIVIEEMRGERKESRKSMDRLTDAIIELARSKK